MATTTKKKANAPRYVSIIFTHPPPGFSAREQVLWLQWLLQAVSVSGRDVTVPPSWLIVGRMLTGMLGYFFLKKERTFFLFTSIIAVLQQDTVLQIANITSRCKYTRHTNLQNWGGSSVLHARLQDKGSNRWCFIWWYLGGISVSQVHH